MGRVVITGPHKDPPSMAIYIILGTLKVTISFYQVLHSPTCEVLFLLVLTKTYFLPIFSFLNLVITTEKKPLIRDINCDLLK